MLRLLGVCTPPGVSTRQFTCAATGVTAIVFWGLIVLISHSASSADEFAQAETQSKEAKVLPSVETTTAPNTEDAFDRASTRINSEAKPSSIKSAVTPVTAPTPQATGWVPEALTRPDTLSAIQEVMDQAVHAEPLLPNPSSVKQTPGVYVFISFSMPEASIKAWLEQAHLAGAAVVLRGLINNSLTDTMTAMSNLYGEDQKRSEAALIDPTLFSRFDIQQVPAVVVTETAASPCKEIDCPTPNHTRIFGDVALRYALDKISLSMPQVRADLKARMKALEPEKTW